MAKPTLNPEPVRWWILASVLAVFVLLVPIPAWIVDDFYSRDTYPWFQGIVTGATNVLPLAVLDLLLIGVLVAVLYRMRRLYQVVRQRGVMDALWEAFRRVVRATAVVLILFTWAWGFNYRRIPLESVTPGGKATLSVEQLQSGLSDANALASRLRPMTQRGEGNYHSIRLDLTEPMKQALLSLNRVPLQTPGQPKFSLVLSPFFRWSGVTGMMNPFGLESIVSADLLPFERPFVLAHEWAHLAGHADEAEASAVGWLACMKAGPAAAYSASLYLIGEAASALPPAEREAAMARLDAGVRSDLDAVAERMRREQHPRVQETTSQIYGQYLKANRVQDGVASYRRALSLVLSPPFRDALSTYTVSR
jgi:hypothetical protein